MWLSQTSLLSSVKEIIAHDSSSHSASNNVDITEAFHLRILATCKLQHRLRLRKSKSRMKRGLEICSTQRHILGSFFFEQVLLVGEEIWVEQSNPVLRRLCMFQVSRSPKQKGKEGKEKGTESQRNRQEGWTNHQHRTH